MAKGTLPPKPDVRTFLSARKARRCGRLLSSESNDSAVNLEMKRGVVHPKAKERSASSGVVARAEERRVPPPTKPNNHEGNSERREPPGTGGAIKREGVEKTRHAKAMTSRPEYTPPEQRGTTQVGAHKINREGKSNNDRASLIASSLNRSNEMSSGESRSCEKRDNQPSCGTSRSVGSSPTVISANDRISLAKMSFGRPSKKKIIVEPTHFGTRDHNATVEGRNDAATATESKNAVIARTEDRVPPTESALDSTSNKPNTRSERNHPSTRGRNATVKDGKGRGRENSNDVVENLIQSIEIPDLATIDRISADIFSSLTSYASEIENYLLERSSGEDKSTSTKGKDERRPKYENKLVEEKEPTGLKDSPERRFEFPSGYTFLESELIREVVPKLDSERSQRVSSVLSELEKLKRMGKGGVPSSDSTEIQCSDMRSRLEDTLRAELDSLVATECPLTGARMVESIDSSFFDGEEEAYELSQWIETPIFDDSIALKNAAHRASWVDRRGLSSRRYHNMVGSIDIDYLHRNK